MDLTRLYTLCYRYYTLSIYAVSFYIQQEVSYIQQAFHVVLFLLYIGKFSSIYIGKKNIVLGLEFSYLPDMFYMLDMFYMIYMLYMLDMLYMSYHAGMSYLSSMLLYMYMYMILSLYTYLSMFHVKHSICSVL